MISSCHVSNEKGSAKVEFAIVLALIVAVALPSLFAVIDGLDELDRKEKIVSAVELLMTSTIDAGYVDELGIIRPPGQGCLSFQRIKDGMEMIVPDEEFQIGLYLQDVHEPIASYDPNGIIHISTDNYNANGGLCGLISFDISGLVSDFNLVIDVDFLDMPDSLGFLPVPLNFRGRPMGDAAGANENFYSA